MTTLQTSVTSNTNSVTKVNNCFADINSSDCPTSRLRSDRDLDGFDYEENDVSVSEFESIEERQVEENLVPNPVDIFRSLFRFKRDTNTRRNKKKNKKKQYKTKQTRSTTPLISNLKILLACMENNADSTCTAKYRYLSNLDLNFDLVSV